LNLKEEIKTLKNKVKSLNKYISDQQIEQKNNDENEIKE